MSSSPAPDLPSGAPGDGPTLPTVALSQPVLTEPVSPAPAGAPPTIPGYEVLAELGRGGMGVVYKARQTGLGRLVALKMILAGSHAGPDELARFRQEARAIARLQHPNIVQVYEVGELDGRPFLSLELCAGGSLAERLRGTPLPARQAAEVLEPLARAVDAAHRAGVVHRDVKPGNVLLSGPREGPQLGTAKITDFGLAKVCEVCPDTTAPGQPSLPCTHTGAVLGTPSYMAPEQAEGNPRLIGPACDIYSLGALLYEMLTGRPPFRAATTVDTLLQVLHQEPLPPRMLNRSLPADLEKIVLKCLEKQPAARYPSAEALADDLHRFLAGEPITARSVNLIERLQRELAHSQHDAYLGPWGQGLMLLAGLVFVAHLATALLWAAGYPGGLAFWAPCAVLLVLMPLLVRYRPQRSLWPTNAVERLLWALWIGYLLTYLSLLGVVRLLGHEALEIYSLAAALSGLAWFAMGGHVWGGCYVIGCLFLVAAPVLALHTDSPWLPFVFGLLWSGALLTLGLRYGRLGKGSS